LQQQPRQQQQQITASAKWAGDTGSSKSSKTKLHPHIVLSTASKQSLPESTVTAGTAAATANGLSAMPDSLDLASQPVA